MEKSKNLRFGIIQTSAYSVLGGFGLSLFADVFTDNSISIAAKIFKYGGIMGMAYYGMTYSKFTKLFENLNLGVNNAYPIQKSKKVGEYSTIYKFTLPCGLSLKDFDDNKDAIEQYLGRDVDIKYTYKEIFIEVYDKKMKTLYEYVPTKIKGDVPIIIGYDRKEKLIYCDLSEGEPHMGVYGESGSGKSTVLRAIITNLILESNVKLHLVDLKNGAEFGLFRKSSKVESFCRNIKETEDVMIQLSLEVDRRYDMFYEKDVKDIKEYNKKFPSKKLNYQILIIDEFADLQPKSKSMSILLELSRKSRACGIHLLIATQRPSAKILDGDIKSNITSILGLKTLNGTNSHVILDETGLEKLRGKGHGIFKRSGKIEIQAPLLEPDKAKELIKHTYIDKVYKSDKHDNIINFDCLEVFDDNNKRFKNN